MSKLLSIAALAWCDGYTWAEAATEWKRRQGMRIWALRAARGRS